MDIFQYNMWRRYRYLCEPRKYVEGKALVRGLFVVNHFSFQLNTFSFICQNVYTKCIYKRSCQYGKDTSVNFRADSAFYQKTKDILADEKITVSDVLNAALRKIANRTVDAREFVSSDLQDTQYQVAFEDLKKEILIGHQEVAQGKVTSVADVRKEFGLD